VKKLVEVVPERRDEPHGIAADHAPSRSFARCSLPPPQSGIIIIVNGRA
jgi:hypothetical protein